MKRKIKITGKVVKKTILWALLVALVVGATILVVKSFNRDNILSNNTALNDIDYSGEYREYLEKELLIKENGGNYEEIIDAQIEIEREKIRQKSKETAEAEKAKYDADLKVLQEAHDGKVSNAEAEKQAAIDEINASDKKQETKDQLIAIEEDKFNDLVDDLNKKLENEKKLLKDEYTKALTDNEVETKNKIENVNERFVLEILVKDILKDNTLTEVIKDENNTPIGFTYSRNDAANTAIKATYSDSLTEDANRIETEDQIESGLKFKFTEKVNGVDVTSDYVYSGKKGSVVYTVDVEQAGFYNILLDYIPFSSQAAMTGIVVEGGAAITEVSGGAAIERKVLVDGVIPFENLANISFLRSWSDGGEKFVDASGNEIKPKQVEKPQTLQQYIRDSVGYVNEPFLVYFTAGSHTIEFASVRENMGIRNVYLTSKENYPSYEKYKLAHANDPKPEGKISYNIQGEGGGGLKITDNKEPEKLSTSVTRSSSTIYGVSDRTSPKNQVLDNDGNLIKSSPVKIILNTIGGAKWSTPGDWINWEVKIDEPGLYKISLRAKQNVSRGLFSSRKLLIDGAVPFEEAMNCKFVYRSDWSVVTLGDESGEEYYFYLDSGIHTFTLECTLGDYASQIDKVQGVIDQLNALYRRIIQRTGINPDPYMDYFKNKSGQRLVEEAKVIFQNSIDTLHEVSENITKISGEKSSETASLDTMGIQLKQFIKDYRKIQKNLQDFSTNISSLGTWILDVSQQALSIDYIMIHTDEYKLPRANPNFFGSFWFDLRGFVGSFFFDYESVGLIEEDENTQNWETIDVWLCTSANQGREQANAISAMINEARDNELKGINVKLKVVSPDVLLTATLAGRGPDVAINVANGTPINYALRGATRDLTEFTKEAIKEHFEGTQVNYENILSFDEMVLADEMELDGGTRRFHPSAMTPYAYEVEDSIKYYALPYTQSYLMMFYRTDMFKEYNWDIPKTWGDVIQLIPELQIMNFQFYLPLNTVGAASVVNQVFASYLYQTVEDSSQAFYRKAVNQFGQEFIESNFDSEEAMQAFEFWCSFYTDYSFPLSANFVNRFRSGETPVGIVGYDTYNTLAVSAPEIRGKWDFALLPGTEKVDEDGNKYVDHLGAASGTAIIMMQTTKNPFESWAFMDWFTSADTQVSFAREIEAILGAAARHNTANVAAFSRLAWTEEEKEVLMDQWESTVGVPEVPGGYYTGRNLENAFREVVNKNLNPRQVLSDFILTINSEIDRKREEFGLPSSTKKGKIEEVNNGKRS